MSRPPVQLIQHCQDLSPEEAEELVTAVAELIVGYLQTAETEPPTVCDRAQDERSGRASQPETNSRDAVP